MPKGGRPCPSPRACSTRDSSRAWSLSLATGSGGSDQSRSSLSRRRGTPSVMRMRREAVCQTSAGESARGSGSGRPSSSHKRSRVRRSRHHRRRPARRRPRPYAPAPLVPSRRPLEVPDPPRTDVTVCDTSRRCPAMGKSQGGRLPRPDAMPVGAVQVSRFSPDTPQRPTGIKTPGQRTSRSRETRSTASLLPRDSPRPVLGRTVNDARVKSEE